MKIVAILETQITDGGAFNQGLNAIVQMQRICSGRFEFEVFSTRPANLEVLAQLGIAATGVRISLWDRVIAYLGKMPWWRPFQPRLKVFGPLERKLIAHGCDLAYFPTPTSAMECLQRMNYIATVYDLCHRDHPEFPEVSEFGRFRMRDEEYAANLARAFIVITESDQLSEKIAFRYGIDRDHCLAMPLSLASHLQGRDSSNKETVLAKYRLREGYFFYPAQFWAHKNHIRILQALEILKKRGTSLNIVFVGSDQGNLQHVVSFANREGISDQVRFLGFVPTEDMQGLYDGCAAVVMPTYFGPTNLPPLEAWHAGKPLIYSAHLAEHAKGAAINVDPDDAQSLADAMQRCAQNADVVSDLTSRGSARLTELSLQRESAEKELTDRLLRFEKRRSCWP